MQELRMDISEEQHPAAVAAYPILANTMLVTVPAKKTRTGAVVWINRFVLGSSSFFILITTYTSY